MNSVKQPDPGTLSSIRTRQANSWWVCLIASMAFCLWGVNVLPIQNVEYELSSNVAVSHHRLPLLMSLKPSTVSNSREFSGVFTQIDVRCEAIDQLETKSSELQSVRVRLRLPKRVDPSEIERMLDFCTIPSAESPEYQKLAMDLLKERWALESAQHSLKRLEMDRERDRLAIEVDRSGQELDASVTPSSGPFRLTSFQTAGVGDSQNAGLLEMLQHLCQSKSEKVAGIVASIERTKQKARGFLSFTGAPHLDPVVRPMTLLRLLTLSVLCLAIWFLFMWWLQPTKLVPMGSFGVRQLSFFASLPEKTAKRRNVADPSSKGFQKTLAWLQREGIPYLGAIELERELVDIESEARRMTAGQQADSVVSDQTNGLGTQRVKTHSQGDGKRILQGLAEGSLVLWIGLFIARILFDPAWRELAVVAPLAAISRMLFGIQQ